MLYYAIGDALVEHDELEQKAASGEMDEFGAAYRTGRSHQIQFRSGVASTDKLLTAGRRFADHFGIKTALRDVQPTAESIAPAIAPGTTPVMAPATAAPIIAAAAKVQPFTPIGLGTPLSVELRHVYTGNQPQKSFFQRNKDMIATSATKGFATYSGAPRAVNMLERAIAPHTDFTGPSAPSAGTPLIFYVPAVTQAATILTIEVMFDNFPDQIFNTVSSAFTAAAGIPVFASASLYLIAAGMITKLLGSLGHGLFDGHTGFQATDTITFARPGAPIFEADYRLLTQKSFDHATLAEYKVDQDGVLVDSKGTPYHGDEPYVVISLDGAPRSEYEGFQPTAASAAILDQFFTVKDGTEQTAQTLIDAMKIYNDWKYRQQADDLKEQLGKLKPGTTDYNAVSAKLDAAKRNILSKELQP